MRNAALTLAALLALAPAALAQDAPPAPPTDAPKPAPKAEPKPAAPARHVNKISDAAKAAFESMQKLMSSPIAKGLQDFSGTIEMKGEMGGSEMPGMGMSFSLNFKAPQDLKVTSKGGEMFGPQTEGMTKGVRGIVLNSLGVYMPSGDDEFDAELVTEEGRKVIAITVYQKGAAIGSMRMTLGDNGLPVSGVMLTKQEMMGQTMEQKVSISWVFEKDGDLHRLAKQVIEVPMMPQPIEYRISYSDCGGFSMATKFVMDMGQMLMGYRFTELTVNGKKVDLGGEAKKPATATPKEGGETKDGKPAGKGGDMEEDGDGEEHEGPK